VTEAGGFGFLGIVREPLGSGGAVRTGIERFGVNLVPRATDPVLTRPVSRRLPVLAAGGLVDGADLATVLSLGAQGAVFGTAFIAPPESFAMTITSGG
jgi:NAD(P)H-dependent flavin oxidoreductase YrpB (nitropropane dioxygenase family)